MVDYAEASLYNLKEARRAVKADDANSAAPTKRAHGITEFLGLKRLPAVVPLAQARPDRRWGLQARLVPLAGEDTQSIAVGRVPLLLLFEQLLGRPESRLDGQPVKPAT